MQLGSPPSYGAEQSFSQPFAPTDCDSAATCNPPIATGDSNISQLSPNANAQGDAVSLQNHNGTADLVTPGATGGTLVDAESHSVIYNGGSSKKQYIGDTDPGAGDTSHVLSTRPISAAALSGSTMRVPGPAAGTPTRIDLTTQGTVQTVPTNAPCVPNELQATAQHWVYWSCVTGPGRRARHGHRYGDGGGLSTAERRHRETARMQAAELFEQKIKLREVARRLRVRRKSAYQWHQLWRDGGATALASRGPSGSRCRLSPRCLEKLAE
ncbi:hypothetical protein ABB07_00430 [Streptomyces incarnatus]|uniref:Transposase n=1 Tax=Streptomyces incarnatus TaxID=665007 RepID=A0ABN4GAM0_9ACTN|nr:helix-turn-helix domain-containing protein [Streptomyces incarnatus]AKJ08568.1 hypothetical protein ABB07_00430 [Streptomyces incarnatus]